MLKEPENRKVLNDSVIAAAIVLTPYASVSGILALCFGLHPDGKAQYLQLYKRVCRHLKIKSLSDLDGSCEISADFPYDEIQSALEASVLTDSYIGNAVSECVR